MLARLAYRKTVIGKNVACSPATAETTAPHRLNVKLAVIARAPDSVRYNIMRGCVLQHVICRRNDADAFSVIIQANVSRFVAVGVK
jgi:hypothetical protein